MASGATEPVCQGPLATLMFVMGLDMLFMAGTIAAFTRRLGGFLGLDTLIFPHDITMNRQPSTKAVDVVHDLYDFRNIIAHGSDIPKQPYRQLYRLVSTTGEIMSRQHFLYTQMMTEASLFILTAAIRRVFTEGLYDTLKHETAWRGQMTLYEHRFDSAKGTLPVKRRGR